jgi:hypothetical protein
MGLISESTEILFAAAEVTTEGLPMPSLKNIELTKARIAQRQGLPVFRW